MTVKPETLAKRNKLLPENERFLRACSDVANALIQEYEASRDPMKPKKDINLNKLRGQIAKKHSLAAQPPLTAIIAAVPEHYKKYILPKLVAKPIRTTPYRIGIDLRTEQRLTLNRYLVWNCGCCRDVQATSLPTHRIYRKYLRLLPRWPRL
jgi:hypothetical protein